MEKKDMITQPTSFTLAANTDIQLFLWELEKACGHWGNKLDSLC